MCSATRCKGGLYTWGPTLRHPVAQRLARLGRLGSIFCFRGDRSLAPEVSGAKGVATIKMFHVYVQPLCSAPEAASSGASCCEADGDDLVCRKQGTSAMARSTSFFDRIAYHMFDTIHGKEYARLERIEAAPLVVSLIYSRALPAHAPQTLRSGEGRRRSARGHSNRRRSWSKMELAWAHRGLAFVAPGDFVGILKVHHTVSNLVTSLLESL
jgi:hypothetical protein